MIRTYRAASRLEVPASRLPPVEPSQLACVIVTYRPDLHVLISEINALPPESSLVIVDNGSDPKVLNALASLLEKKPQAQLAINRENRGLAAGCNQAIELIAEKWPDIQFVLLLDQDSDPEPGAIIRLLQNLVYAQNQLGGLGCVGPQLIDVTTGLSHGFHYMDRWIWRRLYPSADDPRAVFCQNLNGSGTMMPMSLYRRLNGLDENLFIDHVDTDWAFRVLDSGGFLLGVPSAHFSHRMGASGRKVWLGGWRVWPVRTPKRHFFLYRNVLWLLRRPYVPHVWKFWAIVKLGLTLMMTMIIGPRRLEQLRCMGSGILHGIYTIHKD